ncbi:hypothetical protein RIF29_28810 [Crotalaria pallida]|uniref:Uncharacterized protein n=1 Tax=Crotalaria pallida TaxID=3830 RepID=A0AAN9HZR2_CROPI
MSMKPLIRNLDTFPCAEDHLLQKTPYDALGPSFSITLILILLIIPLDLILRFLDHTNQLQELGQASTREQHIVKQKEKMALDQYFEEVVPEIGSFEDIPSLGKWKSSRDAIAYSREMPLVALTATFV